MADPVYGRVEALLTQNLDVAQDRIRPEADLRHDLGLDSFAAVELIYELQEQFAIKVADDEMAGVKTIADLVEAIRRKVPATQ